jgi:hypothetical protein
MRTSAASDMACIFCMIRARWALIVFSSDEGQEETITEVITLDKDHRRIEHLGLSLAASKQLLSTLQRHLLQQQVDTFLDTHSTCPDCGAPLKLKARGSRSFRALFGTFKAIIRGWSIVLASDARPRHSDLCQRCSPSRWPRNSCLWKPSGPLWCPTG